MTPDDIECITHLNNLKELKITRGCVPSNKMAPPSPPKIPAKWGEAFSQLEEFECRMTGQTSIDSEFFSGVSGSLKKAQITHNDLKDIPKSIGECIHLVELDLSCNSLSTVPDSIGLLKSLKKFDLSCIHSFEQHSILTEFLANQLASLPASLSDLRSLETINLQHNLMTVFPECLCQIETVEHLQLNNNKLKQVSSSIGKLSKLK